MSRNRTDAGTNGPRTIVYINWAPFFAGAERALIVLLKALDPSRYRPHVIVGTDGEMRAQLRAEGIPNSYVELCYTSWRHPLQWMRSVGRIAAVTRRVGGVLIHSNGVPGFQPAGYAARLLRVPALTHVRGRLPQYGWFLKPAVDGAMFVSRDLMTWAREQDPQAFACGATVVYDGVTLQALPSADARREGLAALGVPTDRPSVVMSGQVVEVKGIWEYIEAARQLTSVGVAATFVVMGDDVRGGGEMRRRAEARVAELGLTDCFRFLGFRRDAPKLVPLFDIAAVPSHVEPLGNATLEAMASALPVVGARVGGIPEMIADGETGYLVPPRDPAALATALGRLIGDDAMRARMGAAGRQRVAEEFSVEAYARGVMAAYDAALTPRGRAATSPARLREYGAADMTR